MADRSPPASAAVAAPPPTLIVERSAVSVRTLVVSALVVLAVLALASLASHVADLLLVFLVAVVFAEGLRPLVHRLVARRLPLPLAIAVVYAGLIALLALLVTVLVQPIVDEANTLARNFPTYQADVSSAITGIQQQLDLGNGSSSSIASTISGSLDTAKNVLLAIGGYIASILVNLVLVLVLAFLWLVTGHRLKLFVIDLLPLRHQALAADIFREMGLRMGGFLRATAINMLAVGVLTGLACWALGLPSPVLFGIFAGLTAAIPLVGPLLGVLPPVLIALSIGPGRAALVAAVLLLVQLLDANVVVPQVMNRVVSLPALAVVISLLAGGALAGLIGALLAVPVASALQVLVMRVFVPYIHGVQGRHDQAYAEAYGGGPSGGGRRSAPR
ncbi:MAG: AI-2E family transporter [Candidatus Dormibacteria bacterium]